MRTGIRLLAIMLTCLFAVGCKGCTGKKRSTEIPWEKIKEEERKTAESIVKNHTVFYPFKDVVFKGNTDINNFLLDRIPLAAKIARRLRIAKYYAKNLPNGRIEAWDGRDLKTIVYEISRENGRRVFYIEGRYHGSTFKNLTGKGVLVWKYRDLPSGRVHNSAFLYVYLDQKPLRSIGKILKPFLGRLINRKLSEIVSVVQKVGVMIANNPRRVYMAIKDGSPNSTVVFNEAEKKAFYELLIVLQNSEKKVDK